ncbi:unnamed protein product [Prunus armeniaca]|uniref:Uncharacterized protein n=1 Tax=Prunus armeniaca TaxID=36596 RepID=A0A6J5WF82_PRUAR|nr:unnamed protein product [Prunus armeniaca]
MSSYGLKACMDMQEGPESRLYKDKLSGGGALSPLPFGRPGRFKSQVLMLLHAGIGGGSVIVPNPGIVHDVRQKVYTLSSAKTEMRE